jgi:hypothetical protein
MESEWRFKWFDFTKDPFKKCKANQCWRSFVIAFHTRPTQRGCDHPFTTKFTIRNESFCKALIILFVMP